MSDPIEHLAAQDESEHTVSRKRHDALVASQDAEILRLRGVVTEAANFIERWDGDGKLVERLRAALSSPASQDDVIVPRADVVRWIRQLKLAGDSLEATGLVSNKIESVLIEIRALLGAPTRG